MGSKGARQSLAATPESALTPHCGASANIAENGLRAPHTNINGSVVPAIALPGIARFRPSGSTNTVGGRWPTFVQDAGDGRRLPVLQLVAWPDLSRDLQHWLRYLVIPT
jgi:hypothetical protein